MHTLTYCPMYSAFSLGCMHPPLQFLLFRSVHFSRPGTRKERGEGEDAAAKGRNVETEIRGGREKAWAKKAERGEGQEKGENGGGKRRKRKEWEEGMGTKKLDGSWKME